jgi:hypothetical protein
VLDSVRLGFHPDAIKAPCSEVFLPDHERQQSEVAELHVASWVRVELEQQSPLRSSLKPFTGVPRLRWCLGRLSLGRDIDIGLERVGVPQESMAGSLVATELAERQLGVFLEEGREGRPPRNERCAANGRGTRRSDG